MSIYGDYIKSVIRTVPDWPQPGVNFRDITPLLQNSAAFRKLIDSFVHRYQEMELDAIAACVVGGVSFSGGVGTVFGVVTGVIIFTVINYGLTYIGVNPYWQYIIKGAIIIFAVALDSLKYARKK